LRIFQVLASGDSALEEVQIARLGELGIFKIRLGLLLCRFRLLKLLG